MISMAGDTRRHGPHLMRPAVYLEGVAVEFSFGDASRNLSELIFDCVRAAVDDSGQPMEAIDSVVLASHDLVDGRSLSSMVSAPAAGAYLRDEVRYSDDGATAFAAAVMRLEAGHATRSIVAAWGRSSEHDPDQFSRGLFDPFMSRPLGLDEFVLSAFRAQLSLAVPEARRARDEASRRRVAAATTNPRALRNGGFRSPTHHPLEAGDMPLWADITAAAVLSTQPSPIRVSGIGQSSEPYSLGHRDVRTITSLATAAGRALADARVRPTDLDVVELDGLTLIDEALALEAVGFAPAGRGLEFLSADPRCNPSGGGAAGYSIPTMGLVRIVEAALQLRGTAGAGQQGNVSRAMASGSSTVAGQTQAVVVMEAA